MMDTMTLLQVRGDGSLRRGESGGLVCTTTHENEPIVGFLKMRRTAFATIARRVATPRQSVVPPTLVNVAGGDLVSTRGRPVWPVTDQNPPSSCPRLVRFPCSISLRLCFLLLCFVFCCHSFRETLRKPFARNQNSLQSPHPTTRINSARKPEKSASYRARWIRCTWRTGICGGKSTRRRVARF